MLKRSLLAVAVVALLAVGVQAGELKTHTWPCDFVPQELTSIKVYMDIGYFIKVQDQNKKIKLVQDTVDLHKFSGCVEIKIDTNFNATLSCEITATGAVPGDYSCSVSPSAISAGIGVAVNVCATVTNADLAVTAGPTNDVHVATVKIKVKPTV